MPPFTTAVTRSIDLSRNLNALTLAGTQALLRCQFDHSQDLVRQCFERLRNILAETASTSPEQWPEAVQASWREGADAARDGLRTVTAWQTELLHLLKEQTSAAQALLTTGLEDVAPGALAAGDDRKPTGRVARSAPQAHNRLAA